MGPGPSVSTGGTTVRRIHSLLERGGPNMENGQKLVVIGCGGVGGPASVLARKLMPHIDVTNIREESSFIVR